MERRFTKDELLTNITIYWVTQTITSSMRLYYEVRRQPLEPPGQVVGVPTGVAQFPKEAIRPSKEQVARSYNLHRRTLMPAGGHFGALEEPELLVEDIRAFFRPLRAGHS